MPGLPALQPPVSIPPMATLLDTVARLLGRGYRPRLREHTSTHELVAAVADAFGRPTSEIASLQAAYAALHAEKGYADRFGERKTLCFEEAFGLYAACALHRPRTLVEIGTQHGKSTRRILDLRDALELDTRIFCFDVVDSVQHFEPTEATLVLKDVTGSFTADVLEAHDPDVIYLDAHPYHLLRAVLTELIAWPKPVILAIHDCHRGICNPKMRISRETVDITTRTGVWERHVLAEVFGVPDPRSSALDALDTERHRLRVLPTRHGLALLVPHARRS